MFRLVIFPLFFHFLSLLKYPFKETDQTDAVQGKVANRVLVYLDIRGTRGKFSKISTRTNFTTQLRKKTFGSSYTETFPGTNF